MRRDTAKTLGSRSRPANEPSGGFYPGNVTAELRAFDLGRCSAKGPTAYRLLDVREPSSPGAKFGKWFVWDDVKTLCTPEA